MTDEALLPHAARIERALRAQGAAVTASVARGDGNLRGALEASTPLLARALRPLYDAAILPEAPAVYGRLDPGKAVSAEEWADLVRRYVETNGGLVLREINATTWRAVVRVLEEGLAEGLEPEAIARMLRAEWPDLSRSRAVTIARTEGTGARGYASLEGARRASADFGLDLVKVWVSTPDDRTRRIPRDEFDHLHADGQAVPLDQPFVIGGELLMHPGDRSLGATGANTINCRCVMVYEPASAGIGGDTLPARPTVTARSVRPEVMERREAVRKAYSDLRRRYGREIAFDRLAEQHCVSARTIERDVYGA